MRYIIQYRVNESMTTFSAVDAESPEHAQAIFHQKRPDRIIVSVAAAGSDSFARYGSGAWTEEENEAIRANLRRKYAQEAEEEKAVRPWVEACSVDEFSARLAYQERRAHEETQNAEGVHVGDLFSVSWGYDQTNYNYYQVVGLKGAHTIVVREVNTKRREIGHSMTGLTRPIRDSFRSEKAYTLRTKIWNEVLCINAPEDRGTLRPAYDGQIDTFTSYA